MHESVGRSLKMPSLQTPLGQGSALLDSWGAYPRPAQLINRTEPCPDDFSSRTFLEAALRGVLGGRPKDFREQFWVLWEEFTEEPFGRRLPCITLLPISCAHPPPVASVFHTTVPTRYSPMARLHTTHLWPACSTPPCPPGKAQWPGSTPAAKDQRLE